MLFDQLTGEIKPPAVSFRLLRQFNRNFLSWTITVTIVPGLLYVACASVCKRVVGIWLKCLLVSSKNIWCKRQSIPMCGSRRIDLHFGSPFHDCRLLKHCISKKNWTPIFCLIRETRSIYSYSRGSRGGPGGPGPPPDPRFWGPKIEHFAALFNFSIIFFASLRSAYYFFNMLLFHSSNWKIFQPCFARHVISHLQVLVSHILGY